MPGSAKDDIIDLTDIVEEGHPDRPNLKPAKSSAAAAGEMLGDLDLEKEIDQIFADLAPPPAGDKSKGDSDSVASDMLDLDELFADQEKPEATNREGVPEPRAEYVPENAVNREGALVSDDDDDFEKLFAQEDERQQTETETLTDTQAVPEGLAQQSFEKTDWPAGIENGPRDDSAWGDAAQSLESEAPESLETSQQETPEATAVADDQPSPKPVAQEQPFIDGLKDADFASDTPMPEREETAGFRADREAGDTTPLLGKTQDKFEPASASGTDRVDQIATSDVLLERLQAMEARLAAMEKMTGQVEIMVAKAVEDKYSAFAEAVTDEVERRFEQFLEARLDHHMDRLFDQHKAGILEEVRQNPASEASVLSQAGEVRGDEHADATRIAELAAGLDGLRDEVRAEGRDREQNTTALLQDQESRIMETVRQEMQALRTEWGERLDALATDVNRSSRDLAEQQTRLESLPGEWRAWQLAQDQVLAEDGAQELGALSEPVQDERLAELLESRLEAMRAEVMDEMRRAVPLAAAQIIREEIQALAQEED